MILLLLMCALHICLVFSMTQHYLCSCGLLMFVWFQHDTTLLALMCALNVFNDKLVPYSSAIMVELHHSQPVDSSAPGWFVQVWYRNDSSRDPFPLTIPGQFFSLEMALKSNHIAF